MNRLKGLLRDTWWLWTIFFTAGIALTLRANSMFFITIPVLIVAFIYYGMIRYDDDGNHIGE